MTDRWQVTLDLQRLADVGEPDTVDSPGSEWLRYVGMLFEVAEVGDEDAVSALADEAVPIYTHKRWLVWTDLMLYMDESIDEWVWTGEPDDYAPNAAESLSVWVLYRVAERLLTALREQRDEELRDQ